MEFQTPVDTDEIELATAPSSEDTPTEVRTFTLAEVLEAAKKIVESEAPWRADELIGAFCTELVRDKAVQTYTLTVTFTVPKFDEDGNEFTSLDLADFDTEAAEESLSNIVDGVSVLDVGLVKRDC